MCYESDTTFYAKYTMLCVYGPVAYNSYSCHPAIYITGCTNPIQPKVTK